VKSGKKVRYRQNKDWN